MVGHRDAHSRAREEGIEDAADRLEAAEVKEKLLHRAARITDGIGPDVRPARERRELLRRRRRLALVLQPANASVPSRCLFVCRGAVGAEDDEEEDEEEEEDDEAEDDEDMGSEVESEEEEAEEGVVVVVEEEEEESPSPWASVMSSTS